MTKRAREEREKLEKAALRKRLKDIARGAEPYFTDDDHESDLATQMGLEIFGKFLNALRVEFDLQDRHDRMIAAITANTDIACSRITWGNTKTWTPPQTSCTATESGRELA